MNLLRDAWIPVRRRSGAQEWIAPYQITDRIDDDPIVRLASPRPDFDGALIQFLIGVLQTFERVAPKGEKEWRHRFDNPPSPAELLAAFEAEFQGWEHHPFEFDGDGPRFMQDLSLRDLCSDNESPIDSLLIGGPGDNTREENRDHFFKRDVVTHICCCCAAAAVLCRQALGANFGGGHYTGLRRPGPVTTVLCVASDEHSDRSDSDVPLWRTVWINVLRRGVFLSLYGNVDRKTPSGRFPWMIDSRPIERYPRLSHDEVHLYWFSVNGTVGWVLERNRGAGNRGLTRGQRRRTRFERVHKILVGLMRRGFAGGGCSVGCSGALVGG